jgi:hypothetical protein
MIKNGERGVRSERRVVSLRKLQANRQNALRSTGPRTARGREYSRRNALKHGLFAMDVFLWNGAKRESQQQYQELLTRLAEDYQPVGAAEQLEVERIAACWWKLGRAWRYENAEISIGQMEIEERRQRVINSQKLSAGEQARLESLRTAKTEIESAGSISDELMEKMFAFDPECRKQWDFLEELTKEKLAEVLRNVMSVPLSATREFATDPANRLLMTTHVAIYILEHKGELSLQGVLETAHDRVAIPKAEALDRLLRAESAAERNLGRAIDRLERSQRRRKGEALPPPVSIRLTR